MVFIGLISYPLYLWHWILLSFARIVHPGRLPGLAIAGLVAAAFVLAWLTFTLIEKPIRFGARSTMKRIAAPALATVMVAVLGAGAIVAQDGMISRFPAVVQYLSDYPFKFDVKYRDGSAYRYRECFILPHEDLAIKESCVDAGFRDSPTSVFLWGDSHGAGLYSGLRTVQGRQHFKLAQFTTAACGPVPGISKYAQCEPINQVVLDRIRELKPRVVILAACWSCYDYAKVAANLGPTIERLRSYGVKEVALLGPLPQWDPPLPKSLLRLYEMDRTKPIPTRFPRGIVSTQDRAEASLRVMDQRLREKAKETNITFVSLLDIMCNGDGCLTKVGDAPEDLTSFDYAHLTPAGSKYLLERAITAILKRPS